MTQKKKQPFQKKLVFCMILIITVTILIIEFSSYFVIKSTIDKRINKEISATLSSKSQEFDLWVTQQQSTLAYFGDSIQYNDYLNTLSDEEIEHFFANKLTEYVIDYYVVIPDKTTLFASGFVLPDDFDVTARDWYKATIAAQGEFTCTSPYIDHNTGKLCMTISKAYYKESGELDFVLGADIYADYLAEITESIDIFDNAYPILADSNFNAIVHKNEKFRLSVGEDGTEQITCLKDVPEYAGIISQLESDDYSVIKSKDYDGKEKYFVLSKISSTGWYYLYAVNTFEYINQIIPMLKTMSIIFILAIVLSAVIITILVKSVIKPIDELKTAAENMKNGKLNYTPTYYANDSISELCTSISETNKVWTGYITDINDNLDKLSHGSFDIAFNGDYVGDFAKIRESILNISDKLSDIIGGIDLASSQVSAGSSTVAESSNFLAAGVNEQSRTIEELTSLIEKLVEQIDENAASAESAQNQSAITSNNVIECNQRMKELMESMSNISEKAQEIVKIVRTIDDIAFQTNILALNAAVEAARAGAAGKGFAVVAGEVRNLASKSAEAVKNTNALITSTGEAVEKGSRLAQETESALNSVSKGVENVNDLVLKISRASETQANDVKTVSEKISSIDEIVRSTASTAEESAASSEELSSQSRTLQDMVLKFKNR